MLLDSVGTCRHCILQTVSFISSWAADTFYFSALVTKEEEKLGQKIIQNAEIKLEIVFW